MVAASVGKLWTGCPLAALCTNAFKVASSHSGSTTGCSRHAASGAPAMSRCVPTTAGPPDMTTLGDCVVGVENRATGGDDHASKRPHAVATSPKWLMDHVSSAFSGPRSVSPAGVSSYSTRGGTSAKTVRVTRPSRSRPRRVCVSIFWEIPATSWQISLKRRGPPARVPTTSTVHLSPIRSSTRRLGQPASYGLGVASVCRGESSIVTKRCLLSTGDLRP